VAIEAALQGIGGDESGDENGSIASRKWEREGPVIAGIYNCYLTECSPEI
jgi:hypothetical protein